MCKQLILTNGSKLKNAKAVVNAVLPLITARDRHGFGWAAEGVKGHFGERMSELHHGYRLDKADLAVRLPIIDETYNSFGTKAPIKGAMLFHGRTSTNHRSLLNTHPIQRNGWTLVHNGVVNNRGPAYQQATSNDTEHVVHYLSTEGIGAVERHLTGYYAFAALDPNGLLHVCRDDQALLFVAWLPSIESHVFATTTDLIDDLAAAMKWKVGPIEAVRANVYLVFDGNKLIEQRDISPRGYDRVEADLMSASLHREASPASWSTKPWALDPLAEVYCSPEADDDDAMEAFFEACDDIDANHAIVNEYGEPVSLEAFRRYDDISKLQCTITTPEGVVISAEQIRQDLIA